MIVFDLFIFGISIAIVFILNILPFVYFILLLVGPLCWVLLQATPPVAVLISYGRRNFFYNLFLIWPATMLVAYGLFSFIFALDTWAAQNIVRPFGREYFFADLSFWEIFCSTCAFFLEYPIGIVIKLIELFYGTFERPIFVPQVISGVEYGFAFGGNDEKISNIFSKFLFWNVPLTYFSKVMFVAYRKVILG